MSYIVDVTVGAIAAEIDGVGGVLQGEKVKTAQAALVAGLNADGDTIVELLVDDNVVAAADGERGGEVAGNVLLGVKGDGNLLVGEFQESVHVEDLDTVALKLATGNDVLSNVSRCHP